MSQYKLVRFNLNGKDVEKMVDVRASLTDMLRNDYHMTSVKKGCEVGECGACNVIIDGEAFNSCIYLAVWADGKHIRTLESLMGPDGELSDIQQAFIEETAVQCGFCTPGFIMTAVEILETNRLYTDDELRKLLSGHLCRCTGYENILRAVKRRCIAASACRFRNKAAPLQNRNRKNIVFLRNRCYNPNSTDFVSRREKGGIFMVITVGRQYGSGGREIGTMLAKQLGIAYYDDMLLKEAAEESGLCEELFRSFDERPKSFLYSIAMDPYSFSMNHVTPKGSIEQQVYLATYDTIKKLADKGPCVLIGRCADYALKDRDDVINLFITAPLENRIKRVAARNGISENEAKDRIKKTDKSRASYYNYYSAKDWGDAKSYDLCIDSSLLGIDGTVELLKDLIRIKGIK